MRPLSEDGRRILTELAERHGISLDAATHMLMAVAAGGGSQAQFNHPELGGMGQWSLGGMTMVGDMFNNGLKAKVDWLCQELSGLIRNQDMLGPMPTSYQGQSQQQGGGSVSLFVSGGTSMSSGGWPAELGHPASVGSQDNLRYAFFPESRRLVIDLAGHQTIYDTGDHHIGGFSQQQGGDQSLSFTSQYGLVRVADLAIVQPQMPAAPVVAAQAPPVSRHSGLAPARAEAMHWPQQPSSGPLASTPMAQSNAPTEAEDDIFAKIERLADLHGKGILTDEEFSAKKADLLGRL
ncbi:SHOCT domain-containing protein [Rhizobium sp. SL42]|uniref:SHOCT domain-containing protein n=1 Tax=Rhizobium sp. SL42 TaxID=2806346 RepID=UPI001F3E8700|nr:SHOCT domain-containing protein [Rhizobium sp. SL42]UJW74484.1 SHOCT domain-containing protein [Rhizobium sp. SL42]